MSKKCAKICRIGKMVVTLHSQIGETEMQTLKRCGSSAWLEYMPVTHGVASSSLVRTAVERGNEQLSLWACCSFFLWVVGGGGVGVVIVCDGDL